MITASEFHDGASRNLETRRSPKGRDTAIPRGGCAPRPASTVPNAATPGEIADLRAACSGPGCYRSWDDGRPEEGASAPVSLRQVVHDALTGLAIGAFARPFARTPIRITFDGPEVRLAPRTAKVLSLIFCDLARHAVAHGALATSRGRVRLFWHRTPDDCLHLFWQETHGCSAVRWPIAAPVSTRLDRALGIAGRGARPAASTPAAGSARLAALVAELGGRIARAPVADGYEVDIMLPAQTLAPWLGRTRSDEGARLGLDWPKIALSRPAARRVTTTPPCGPDLARPRAAPWDQLPECAAPATSGRRPRTGLPRHVLVVEDNPLIGEDLAAIVRGLGAAEVSIAFTAAEARACLAPAGDGTEAPFDLVLLDVTLGDVSAETLLPLLRNTRVVLVSGRSREELPEALARFELISKPFEERGIGRVMGLDA